MKHRILKIDKRFFEDRKTTNKPKKYYCPLLAQ